MYQFYFRIVILTLFIMSIAATQTGYAADTTEVYDIGATDFEFYLGYDGIGRELSERDIAASALAGFGFIEAFSGYLAIEGTSNEDDPLGTVGLSFGVFGTPFDTEHVDLDLVLNIGAGSGYLEVTPGVELNLDLKDDLQLAGLYLRFEETFAGRESDSEEESRYVLAPQTGLAIGAYWSLIPEHQILLEYDMGLLHDPGEGERKVEVGAIALGYNLMVVNSIEFLGQLSLNIPQEDEDVFVGIMLGMISTMPTCP